MPKPSLRLTLELLDRCRYRDASVPCVLQSWCRMSCEAMVITTSRVLTSSVGHIVVFRLMLQWKATTLPSLMSTACPNAKGQLRTDIILHMAWQPAICDRSGGRETGVAGGRRGAATAAAAAASTAGLAIDYASLSTASTALPQQKATAGGLIRRDWKIKVEGRPRPSGSPKRAVNGFVGRECQVKVFVRSRRLGSHGVSLA